MDNHHSFSRIVCYSLYNVYNFFQKGKDPILRLKQIAKQTYSKNDILFIIKSKTLLIIMTMKLSPM